MSPITGDGEVQHCLLGSSLQSGFHVGKVPVNNDLARRTNVAVHRPASTSQARTVKSHPQLYAAFDSVGDHRTAEIRLVCDFNTVSGAFAGMASAGRATLRLFFLSPRSVFRSYVGTSTSSEDGIDVDQTPTSESQPAVRSIVPDELEAIDETALECKCRDANGLGPTGSSSVEALRGTDIIRAVVSYEALAMSWDSSSSSIAEEDLGITHTELTGAE